MQKQLAAAYQSNRTFHTTKTDASLSPKEEGQGEDLQRDGRRQLQATRRITGKEDDDDDSYL